MELSELIKITVTVVIAVIGWIIAHYFSSRRDRTIKRREIITKHLIDTYKFLTHEIVQRDAIEDQKQKLELVVAELQLFGTTKQIGLAKEFANAIASGGDFLIDDLLDNLRNDLRKELELEPVKGEIRYLRFNKKK